LKNIEYDFVRYLAAKKKIDDRALNRHVHIFKHAENKKQWDLGLTHAFLDLVDIAEVVPRFCRSIKPGGLVYLTLNYDGETILLPAVDRTFDERIMQLYNQSMDERTTNGKTAGDSKTVFVCFDSAFNTIFSGLNLHAFGLNLHAFLIMNSSSVCQVLFCLW